MLRGWLLLTAFSATPAFGQDDTLSEQSFLGELPQVLSASRLQQPMSDTPVAITVIDRETIAASGAIDLPQLLRLVPGFQVADVDGTDSIATYHGFSGEFSRRMQVMVDGRSIYDPGLAGVFWSSLPITVDQVERIEVVRGANAAAYGSNAVLGSINIVTRHSSDEPGPRLGLLAGSLGTLRMGAQYSGRFADTTYRLSASHRQADGYDDRYDSTKAKLFNLRTDRHTLAGDSLTFQFGFRETDFQTELFRYPRDREFRAHYEQLVWNRVLGPTSDLRLQLYHNYFEATDPLQTPEASADLGLRTHRYDVELQHVLAPAPDWRISWGGGLRLDQSRGAGIFTSPDDLERKSGRAFVNAEWTLSPEVLLNGGLMLEQFDELGFFSSPRLALNWKPVNHHSFRVSASRGYRVPTLFEQNTEVKFLVPGYGVFRQIISDPAGLKSEHIEATELGYLYELPRSRGHLDVRIYQDVLKDVIMDIQNEWTDLAALTYSNVGDLKVRGLETQATLRPAHGTEVQLAYAYADAPGERLARIGPPGRTLYRANDLAVPTHTASLLLSQALADDWQVSAVFNYVSGMTWLSEGNAVPAMRRLDARVSKRLRLPGADLQLSFLAHNLLNHNYWEFQAPDGEIYGNQFERRLYTELVIQPR